jgi:hypothetical protein
VKKPDYDPARFDALGYLKKTDALVREMSPKAKLVSFEVTDVGPDGRADLGLSGNGYAQYYYRSSVAPCELSVVVLNKRVIARVDSADLRCGGGSKRPTCKIAEVHARAMANGLVFKDERARFEWTGSGWEVWADNAGIESLDDDCSATPDTSEALATPIDKSRTFDANKRMIERPLGGADKVDPTKYVATARSIARELESDAELVSIDVGKVIETGDDAGHRSYKFRSPAAMASDEPDRLNCIVVQVRPWGEDLVRAMGAASRCERGRAIKPQCTVKEIVGKLSVKIEGFATVTLDDRGWRVVGGDVDELILDTCDE